MQRDNELIQAIFDTTVDRVAVVDRSLQVLKASRTFCLAVHVPDPRAIVGQRIFAFFPGQEETVGTICDRAWARGLYDAEVGEDPVDNTVLRLTAVRVATEDEGAAPHLMLSLSACPGADDRPSAVEPPHDPVHPVTREFARLLGDAILVQSIALLDPDGNVVSWNAGAERVYGYTATEAVGRHIGFVFADEERPCALARHWLAQTAVDGTMHREGWHRRRDGTRFWADCTMTGLRQPSGDLAGFALGTRDHTDRRLAHEARRRRELESERERTLRRVLQLAAHEMRNPMTALLGAVSLLRQPALDARVRDGLLAVVGDEVRRLERTLAAFVETAEREGPGADMAHGDFRSLDLGALASRTALDHRVAKSHRLVLETAEGPLWVRGRSASLEQALGRLLDNAAKFSAAGSTVRVRVSATGTVGRVTVSDEGIGIAEAAMDRVFERYFSLDPPPAQPPGLGMGLYLARETVSAHNGRIWLESALGQGCTAHLELPLDPESSVDVAN